MSPAVERVIAILRRDVPRPATLPASCMGGGLRWGFMGPDATRRWPFLPPVATTWPVCPLGLHPQARVPVPTIREHLAHGPINPADLGDFVDWWDQQTDPAAAVAAVWGPA